MDQKTVNSWKEQAPTKSILMITAGLTAFVAFTFLLCTIYFDDWNITIQSYKGADNFSVGQSPEGNSMARLQVLEAKDFKEYYAAEQVFLNEYAWEDETNGIVRVPVEEAMNMVLEKGLPSR